MLFHREEDQATKEAPIKGTGFDYLSADDIYFDSACQSLRPREVMTAMSDYYTKYNSCGERVKYRWGLEVDKHVDETREELLKLLKCSPKKYFASFTQNTTYGLNLILSQLKPDGIEHVVTSDIEHNSVFLSTLSLARRLDVPRIVLTRNDDGSVNTGDIPANSVVVLNAVSNIDGRQLKNINNVAGAVHRSGGLFVIDAAQTMAYYHSLVAGVDFDALCLSSHKMYGPSLGAMVVKKSLLDRMSLTFLGGGMVDDVQKESYVLSAENEEHIHTALEPGLQPYAEIIGLGAAIRWMQKAEKGNHILGYSGQLIDFLKNGEGFHVLNRENTTTIAFYNDKFDAHLLAEALSDAGIMTRSGHFCAHYYLAHVKKYPPLVRLSLGLHNRQSDIDKFIEVMGKVAG